MFVLFCKPKTRITFSASWSSDNEKYFRFFFRDDTHMTSMKIVQFSRPPHPPPTPLSRHVPWTSNNFKQIIPRPPLGPRVRSPNDNQLIKRKHNPRMNIMLSEFSFKSAFVFSISSLILSGFPMASFHLAEANLTPRVILKYENFFFAFLS